MIHEESVRNLEAQASILDGLRERAGTLLAAAALVTGFLAPPALKVSDGSSTSEYHFICLSWAATGCFVGAVVASLVVLLPRKWTFGHDAHDLMDKFLETDPPSKPRELYYHLAYYNEKHHKTNAKKMGWLFLAFGLGCGCLAAEIGLWLGAIVM
jgi:hypothetical protein